MLATATACAGPVAVLAQTPPVPAVAQRDLDQLAATLNDPQARQDQRDEAARRLVSRQSADARRILANALVDLNQGGQLAAARALADDPEPDPELINPLFAALGGNRALTEATAHALANYRNNPEVLSRLIGIVQRRPSPPEFVREKIVRAVGSIVEKRTAEFLINVIKAPDETPVVRDAAADALADLTGILDYGQDLQRWADWWERIAGASDADFRNDVLPRRSLRYDQLRQRYAQLTGELGSILDEQYQTAAPSQRSDILMRYLKSVEPEVRAVAAGIIKNDALDNKTIPAAAKDQLRAMIGDSSAKVRAAAAEALAPINDAASLDALLSQLAQETEGQVRAAIARALWPINDLRAVPALLGLLQDPSYLAATAAAQALEQLGPKIRDQDPALAQRTARELRDTLERRSAGPSAEALREALIDAMVPLRQEELLPLLYRLLDERRGEPAEIRRLALKAAGEIGNAQAAAVIANALNDRDARVRLEAVRALNKVHVAAEYAETLRRRLDPNEEPDQSVREETWQVLQSVFPQLPKEQLVNFAERFKNEPERQIIVLKALAEQLLKLKMEDELATTRQNIGQALMRLNEPKEAAEYFRLALEYKKTQQVPGVVIVGLMEDRMKGLLLSKQYPEAIAFAAANIRENPNNQQPMGTAIKNEADRLRTNAALDDALKLIDETRKMDPPLAAQYREQLAEIETDIRKRLSERGGVPPASRTSVPAVNTPGGQ